MVLTLKSSTPPPGDDPWVDDGIPRPPARPDSRVVDVREALDAIDRLGGVPPTGYFVGPARCPQCLGRWRPEPGERACRSCKLRGSDLRRTIPELKELRRELGLSQGELAQLLGLHPNTIAKWENGRQACRNAKLVGLAVRALRPVAPSRNEEPPAQPPGRPYAGNAT